MPLIDTVSTLLKRSQLQDTGVNHRCDKFVDVSQTESGIQCPNFDAYKYGLTFSERILDTHSYIRNAINMTTESNNMQQLYNSFGKNLEKKKNDVVVR